MSSESGEYVSATNERIKKAEGLYRPRTTDRESKSSADRIESTWAFLRDRHGLSSNGLAAAESLERYYLLARSSGQPKSNFTMLAIGSGSVRTTADHADDSRCPVQARGRYAAIVNSYMASLGDLKVQHAIHMLIEGYTMTETAQRLWPQYASRNKGRAAMVKALISGLERLAEKRSQGGN